MQLYWACNCTKSITPSWVFFTFLNCTKGTKSHKASQLYYQFSFQYAEMETILGDIDRARAIYELAINQSLLDMPEVCRNNDPFLIYLCTIHSSYNTLESSLKCSNILFDNFEQMFLPCFLLTLERFYLWAAFNSISHGLTKKLRLSQTPSHSIIS